MSATLRVFELFTSAVYGPPAACAGRYKLHLPSVSAVDERLSRSSVTVTCSSGSAHPQKCMGLSLWSTMWLLRILGRVTSPLAAKLLNNAAPSKLTIRFIVPDNIATPS